MPNSPAKVDNRRAALSPLTDITNKENQLGQKSPTKSANNSLFVLKPVFIQKEKVLSEILQSLMSIRVPSRQSPNELIKSLTPITEVTSPIQIEETKIATLQQPSKDIIGNYKIGKVLGTGG